MILEIDFDNKTVEVKDSATLGEVVAKLKELKLDWRKFTPKGDSTYTIYPTWPVYPITPYAPYTPIIPSLPWTVVGHDLTYTTNG